MAIDERDGLKHPMQPVGYDDRGVIRFKKNAIVEFLLDNGPFDMSDLAMIARFSREDREQFAQLIGYSASAYSSLSYVSEESASEADERAKQVYENRKAMEHLDAWQAKLKGSSDG